MNIAQLMALDFCKECGSKDASWQAGVRNTSGVQDGRLRSHDLQPVFILGCNFCSETLKVVSGDNMAALLNGGEVEV